MTKLNTNPEMDAAINAIAQNVKLCVQASAVENKVTLPVAIAAAHAEIMAMMLEHLGAENVLIAMMQTSERVSEIYNLRDGGDLASRSPMGRA